VGGNPLHTGALWIVCDTSVSVPGTGRGAPGRGHAGEWFSTRGHGYEVVVGIALSLIVIAVGLILALAVHPANPGWLDPNTAGWILFVVGFVGLILDLLLWSPYGLGYLRHTTVVDRRNADPTRPSARGGRRTVVDEEEVAGPGAGAPPPV